MNHLFAKCAFVPLSVLLLTGTTAHATTPEFVQQAYLKGSNNAAGDEFGTSVSIDGDTAVVGAPKNDTHATDAGLAYVFVRDADGNWTQQAILAAPFPKEGDNFGHSVAISGDTIVVGTPLDDNVFQGVNPGYNFGSTSLNSGAAYVFTRTGNTWNQQAYLKASNAAAGHQFGWSVAIHGDSVIVGAPFESSIASLSGAAYVFTRTGTSWSQQAYLKLPNAAASEQFGHSVDIHGDFAIVGAPAVGRVSSIDPGAAFIYERTGSTWSQQGSIAALPGTDLWMGWSVAISGDLAVVGARNESSTTTGINGEETNTGANGSGAVYILQRIDGTWTRTTFLKASNTRGSAFFGHSVAIDGRTVLVGSSGERSLSTGVNGDQAQTAVTSNPGAAYQFQLNDGQWSQTAYIKASNTRSLMFFGWSVAVSRGSLIVGAYRESSDATTVNGDQTNTSASGAGAAYVLKFQDSGPDLALETTAGAPLLNGLGVVNFPVAQVPLTVRNLGLSPLGNPAGTGGVQLAISGPDAAFFTLNTPALTGLIDPDGSASFALTFDPTGPAGTPRNATLTLSSNDPTEPAYLVALTGTALSETTDTDGDGIPDATEFRLSALGFDWQSAQPELAAILFTNASGAGLFTETQVRDLNLPAPLIKRDPASNRFTLEIGLQKSDDLIDFEPFPFTGDDTTINPEGRIEFEFPGTGSAEFFRLQTQ